MTTLTETFNQYRKITSDEAAAILAFGSLLLSGLPSATPLRVSEAAKMLNVSRDAVYALCSSGKLPHHNVGVGRGTIRIFATDVERYRSKAA